MQIDPTVIALTHQARQRDQRLVLATGVFDILHEEHRLFLEKAKQLGDVLLVGIESDARVRKMKGEGRPINPAQTRRANLMGWQLADGVFILPEQFDKPEDHEALIALLRPNFLAVSSHTLHQDNKKAVLEKYGGQLVVVHDHNPAVSTSQILAKSIG